MSSGCVGEGDTVRALESPGLVPWRCAPFLLGFIPGTHQWLGASFPFSWHIFPPVRPGLELEGRKEGCVG